MTLLDAFYDAGCNFIDTAEGYYALGGGGQGGESGNHFGEWLRRAVNREEVVSGPGSRVDMGAGAWGSGVSRNTMRAWRIRSSASQTGYIDLYETDVRD